jgi:hypothetical protein
MNVRTAPLTFDFATFSVSDTLRMWHVRATCLLLALGVIRLAVISVLPLSDGEAYYYMWSRFPAWSYYDHPPMIAWLSWGTTLVSQSPLAIRLGPVLCAELGGALIYVLAARLFSSRVGFMALALVSVLPVFWTSSIVLNPEAPLAPLWLLCLILLWTMRDRTEGFWPLLLGLTIGLAFLSKYTGILLVPITLLFFAICPAAQHWWRRPAFYLGGGVALLMAAPVLGWNIVHGWPSLKLHLVERVAVANHSVWSNAVRVALGQIGFFHPLLFPGLLAALGMTLARARKDERFQFLAIASWLPLLFLVATMIKVPDSESHWTMVAFMAIIVAAAGWVDGFIDEASAWFRWYWRVSVGLTILAGFAAYAHARSPVFFSLLPADAYDGMCRAFGINQTTLHGCQDVSNEFFGWDQVQIAVENGAAGLGPGVVVASTQYSLCAHLMYALDDHPRVYCPTSRRTQFDFIDRHTPPTNASVLFVNNDHYSELPSSLLVGRVCKPYRTVIVKRGGLPVQHYHLFACQPLVPPANWRDP